MQQTPTTVISELFDATSNEERVVVGVDLAAKQLVESDFFFCTLRNCHFNEAKLTKCGFDTCIFEHCNFNMCVLTDTNFKNCEFKNCTFVGVDFAKLRVGLAFESVFSNCNIGFAVFSSMKLMKSKFLSCNLEEVDFSEAKMDEVVFTFSDLSRAIFNHTDLRKSDFRGAHNYTIDPRSNFLKGAVFSEPEVMSLLQALNIKIAEPPEEAEN